MGRLFFYLIFSVAVVLSGGALAGPEGTYSVEGANPGGGSSYKGSVTVKQSGQTYSVVWNVGGTKFVGTGLGATNVNGSSTMGPASNQDTAIAVSYISNGSYGVTFYVEQENGQWEGIWTFGGSSQIGTETWTRVN